jgi:hypothetical protein
MFNDCIVISKFTIIGIHRDGVFPDFCVYVGG